MDRRLLLGGALAALVVLSGCSWVQETPPATPNASAAEPPSDGIGIPAHRLRNHTRSLTDTSYAVEMAINVSTNGTRIDRSFAVRSDPSTETQVADLRDRESRTDRYVGNGTIYTRLRADGSTGYDVREFDRFNLSFASLHQRSVSTGRLAGVYQFGRFDESGTVTRDGRTLTEFELVETPLDDNATVDTATGRVLVGQDGVVRLARIDITGTNDGDPFFVHTEYRVTATEDVRIDRPDWIEAARRNHRQNESATTGATTGTTTPGTATPGTSMPETATPGTSTSESATPTG